MQALLDQCPRSEGHHAKRGVLVLPSISVGDLLPKVPVSSLKGLVFSVAFLIRWQRRFLSLGLGSSGMPLALTGKLHLQRGNLPLKVEDEPLVAFWGRRQLLLKLRDGCLGPR